MARATVTGAALSNLVARVEAIRQVLGEIDEKYGSRSVTIIHYPSDINPIRDWYLALVEQKAKHVMLEQEDYQNYFYILGINIDEYESRARNYHDQEVRRKNPPKKPTPPPGRILKEGEQPKPHIPMNFGEAATDFWRTILGGWRKPPTH